MSTDLERLLREGMERFTDDVQVPAGLARHVVLRHRRRIAMLAFVACVAVGGIVGGYLAAGLPTAEPAGLHSGTRLPQAYTVAYVLSRAAQAASQQHLIERASTVELGAANTAAKLSQVAWTYGIEGISGSGMARSVVTSGGSLQAEYASTWRHGRITTTAVEYLTRTWYRTSGPYHPSTTQVAPKGCSLDFSSADYYAFLHWGLYCTHDLRIAGKATVDGVQTLKIVTIDRGPSPVTTLDYWVNPQTFLPVRTLFDNGDSFPAVGRIDEQTDYQWLAPSTASLAELAIRIPIGFRWDPSQPDVDACLPPAQWDIPCG